MSTLGQPIPESTSQGLRRVLNRHGYGFQYATLKRCIEAQQLAPIPWRFAVDEYPVELNGHSTHIDFILAAGAHQIVAECKRVRGWWWGFARSRSSRAVTHYPAFDFLYWSSEQGRTLLRQTREVSSRPPYHVALEIKVDRPASSDDREKDSPKYLDGAVTQVMRARGGLIQDMLSHGGTLRYGGGAIVPVIFTTAELLVTEADLAEADAETGEVPDSVVAQPVDWLWYNYNLSPSLQPHAVSRAPDILEPGPTKTEALRGRLTKDVRRSIAVVRPAGIESFLSNLAVGLTAGSDPV